MLTLTIWMLIPATFHPLRAQQLPLTTYNRSSGLLSDYVLCMEQDRNGFIWFGTDRGLSRYDGKNYLHLTEADGLPDLFVTSIFPDTDGTVWAGTYQGGAVHVTDSGIVVYDTASGLRSNYVRDIMRDRHGTMLFETSAGIAWLSEGRVDAALVRGKGAFLICMRDSSALYATRGPTNPLQAVGPPDRRLERLNLPDSILQTILEPMIGDGIQASNGDLYLRSWNGVLRLQSNRDGKIETVTRVAGFSVSDLTETPDGDIWGATTSGGMFRYDGREVHWYGVDEGLPTPRVESLLTDYEGNLWISVFGHGVRKLTQFNAVRYTHSERLHDDQVQCFYLDQQHRLWIGTQSGLNVFEGERIRAIPNRDGRMNEIRAITTDRDGRYYIGTLRHLIGPAGAREMAAPGRLTVQLIPYGVSGFARVDPRTGYDLIVGTYGNGLSLANRDTVVEHAPHGGMAGTMIEGVVPGRNWNWILTRTDGAFRVDERGIDPLPQRESLVAPSVYALFESARSTKEKPDLWFSTGNAIIRLDGDRMRSYTGDDGLRGLPAVGIFPAATGKDPGGSGRGSDDPVYVITPSAVHLIRDDSITVVQTLTFLLENRISLNGAFYDSTNSILWLGTTGGAFRLDLTMTRTDNPPPKVSITEIRVGSGRDRQYPVTRDRNGELELPPLGPDENDLVVEFAGLSFMAEGGVRYRTKLEPVDSRYSDPGRGRSTLFRSLSDGEYRFHVIAVNEWNVESTIPAVLHFSVLPPVWKRWWFVGSVGMVLLALAGFGARMFTLGKIRSTVRELERRQAIQDERERISRDLHDHVGGQLAGLITGLDLANRYEDSETGKRKEVLAALRDDARSSMEQLRETIWALQANALTVESFCAEVRKYGTRHFRYLPAVRFTVECRGTSSTVLHPHEVLELLRIAQQALANALQHARPTRVEVLVESDPAAGCVRMSVVNDGAAAGDLPANPLAGRGLDNMVLRMSGLGGSLHWELSDAGIFRVVASFTHSGS